MKTYDYLVVGGGISADAACRAIRSLDPQKSIGLIGEEAVPPYNRPPLSKGLWHDQPFDQIWRGTDALDIEVLLGRKVVQLDPAARQVQDDRGDTLAYANLLLATGGSPIRLPTDASGQAIYFRTLADYQRLRESCQQADDFAVLGGGFIGSEIAAVLSSQGKKVRMLFLEDGVCARIFPPDLSTHLNNLYQEKGVQVLPGRRVSGIEKIAHNLLVSTDRGEQFRVDSVVGGLGIRPNLELARQAGLAVGDGILVDARMRTSDPNIYASGDVVCFPSTFLGRTVRFEHEEHANLSGKVAGENMAGGDTVYDPVPYLYSTIFDLTYDALGELDPQADVFADWIEPYRQGTLYYRKNSQVRGIVLWNLPGRRNLAEEILKSGELLTHAELRGRIQPLPVSTPRRIIRTLRKDNPANG